MSELRLRDATPGDIGLVVHFVRALADYEKLLHEVQATEEEFQGGGFSISNMGMYGVKEFSAIINPPQAGILAVAAGEQRPVVRKGELAVATVMTCTLSVDHRVIDGALAAEFMQALKGVIEDPLSLML